jgi:hypothetical protein
MPNVSSLSHTLVQRMFLFGLQTVLPQVRVELKFYMRVFGAQCATMLEMWTWDK